MPGLQKEQLLVKVAKGLLWLDLQLHGGTGFVALQCFFNGRQQIFAADQKLNRFV